MGPIKPKNSVTRRDLRIWRVSDRRGCAPSAYQSCQKRNFTERATEACGPLHMLHHASQHTPRHLACEWRSRAAILKKSLFALRGGEGATSFGQNALQSRPFPVILFATGRVKRAKRPWYHRPGMPSSPLTEIAISLYLGGGEIP